MWGSVDYDEGNKSTKTVTVLHVDGNSTAAGTYLESLHAKEICNTTNFETQKTTPWNLGCLRLK